MKNLIIREVGRNTVKQENGMIHPEGFGVILCTQGRGTVTYGDMVYTLERNVLLLFMSYSVIHIEQEFEDMKGLLLEADTETTLQLLSDISMERRISIVQQPCVKIADGDERLVRQIFDVMTQKERAIGSNDDVDTTDKRILEHLAHASCLEILQVYSKANKLQGSPLKRNNVVYNRFIESVCANCHSERTVTFYARQQNLSVGHFSTIVRNVSGHAPMYWIEMFTMTAIKKMLRETSLSFKEIADRMSFPDQSTFGRYFKERESMSPSLYRTRKGA